MDKALFQVPSPVTPSSGYIMMIGLGVVSLLIAVLARRSLVRNTHDYIIADRRVGLGFGVGSLIAVWTWAMAVMMSSGMTYAWGLSGLFWFTVPNGLAVMLLIPFARVLRRRMPKGYTLAEFAEYRFNHSKAVSGLVTAGMIFGSILEILINLKGTSLMISTVFGIDWRVVTVLTIVIVLTYSYIGGLWTSTFTATLNTWMITVPAAVVVAFVFDKVGGGSAVWNAVATSGRAAAAPLHGEQLLSLTRPEAAAGFGVTLAFGLIASTVSSQDFWQKAWSLKRRNLGKTFLWAGALFYPIPICLGLLGLVGIASGLTPRDIGGDVVAIGPYIVSHIGLPTVLILLYVLAILAACYSTIDGASAAISSIVAIDILKRYIPAISEKMLFFITKLSIFIGGSIAVIIVLTGVDFTTLVLVSYAIKTSILLPMILAILWSRANKLGFLTGVVSSIAIGMPIYFTYGELYGTLAILVISGGCVLIAGLLSSRRFDFTILAQKGDLENQTTGSAILYQNVKEFESP